MQIQPRVFDIVWTRLGIVFMLKVRVTWSINSVESPFITLGDFSTYSFSECIVYRTWKKMKRCGRGATLGDGRTGRWTRSAKPQRNLTFFDVASTMPICLLPNDTVVTRELHAGSYVWSLHTLGSSRMPIVFLGSEPQPFIEASPLGIGCTHYRQ